MVMAPPYRGVFVKSMFAVEDVQVVLGDWGVMLGCGLYVVGLVLVLVVVKVC